MILLPIGSRRIALHIALHTAVVLPPYLKSPVPPPPPSRVCHSHACTRNKDQTAERERSYFASHGHRRCVVVVGDKPGDADVTIGFAPDERCLKIGFFDHSHEHPHPDLPPLPPPPPSGAPEAAAVANNGEHNTNDEDNHRLPGSFPRFLSETNSRGWKLLGSTATKAAAVEATGVVADSRNNRDAVAAVAAPAATRGDAAVEVRGGGTFVSSKDNTRIQGRPGSQGGGEIFFSSSADDSERMGEGEGGRQPSTAVAEEELLRAYGDRFDVVACGGHSMDLVADFVRHFVGSSSPDEMAAKKSEGRGP